MTEKYVEACENFLKTELFDISHSDLETKLQQDRIRTNLGVQGEDINFLKDQRSASKAHMTNLDVQYGKKKEAQLKRKIGPTATSSSQEDNYK